MDIVADASAFIAVVLNEVDRDWIIKKTTGLNIISSEVLPYEIGNALIAVKKKERLDDLEILRAFDLSQSIAVKLVPVNMLEALKIAIQYNIYAYDAYYLQCCIENKLSLMSLDGCMCNVAMKLGIKVVA
jgi:predicted nucleic acid-binding protein